jgi:hypothetical protein
MSFRQKARRITRPVRREGPHHAKLAIGLLLILGTLFLFAFTAGN